jgi:hypothetical protein
MAIFDQRGQTVQYQYNAAGNVNFSSVQNRDELVTQLNNLLVELTKAAGQKAIGEEEAVQAKCELELAIVQAKKPEAKPGPILQYLEKARGIVESVAGTSAAVGGLISAIKEAAGTVARIFS